MPTAAQLTALLDQGHSYETAARQLGIPPGLAFMIATGGPADGSSPDLVNPPPVNPTRNAHVVKWVKGRANRELKRSG